VHGAALTASPEALGISPEVYLRQHVDTALDVLAWAAKHVAGRTLLVSSDAVFSQTLPGAIDEDAPTQPIGMYGIAKVLLEQTAQTLRHDYGRDVIAIRLGAIYGQGELPRPSRPRVSRVARMINDALNSGCILLDEAARTQAWTYAADVGAAARALLEAPTLAHALYHVASEEVISAKQMADAMTALLPDVTIQHERAGDAVPDQRQHTLSNRRLREDTGFAAWTPFAHGLAATLEWQRGQLAVAS
jgi:nucleoside-diphosphate-sugar epimerase